MKLKSLLYLLAAGMLLSSCGSSNTGDYTVNGLIRNAEGKMVYFNTFQGPNVLRLDSAKVGEDGQFSLKSPVNPKLDFFQIMLEGNENENMILVLDSTMDVTVEASYPNLISNYKVTGSSETDLLLQYYRASDKYQADVEAFNAQLQSANPADVDARNAIEMQRQTRSLEHYNYLKAFVDQNPGAPATLSVLSSLDPTQDLDLFKKAEVALRSRMAHNSYHVDRIAGMIVQVEQLKQQEAAAKAQQEAQNARLAKGTEAPIITMNNPDGKSMSLSDLRGKVVLIDFWASWCKPCRAENPNVVRLYDQYKSKGFDIFSVSLDKDVTRWKQAIEADNLKWKSHVSDLGGWQSAANALYGVNSIPFTALIDRDGKIIATNLRGASLEQKLAEVLGD